MGRAAAVVGALLVLGWITPLPTAIDTPSSRVVTAAGGEALHVVLSPDERWRLPVSLSSSSPGAVDPRLVDALIALEDRRFGWHVGVDPWAIVRATVSNVRSGRVISGGSTLHMQVVRLLEPRPRTVGSKLVEALRALQLGVRLGDDAVLRLWLERAPFGGNLEGVHAAAWAYFGHGADRLSPDEIAVLLAVPQRPGDRYPRADHAAALGQARDRAARRLHAAGRFDDADLAAVLAAPVPSRLVRMPRLAPHAARVALGSVAASWVPTTIDYDLQRSVEALVARRVGSLRTAGIHNGAIVVVEHDTGAVRALVGNLDFWDPAHGGQIASFGVPRSPGSTLKPLLYGLEIEGGHVLPSRLLLDVPTRYAGYVPENYDRQLQGVARAEDALNQSLNLPFVRMLARHGVEPFLGSLRAAGARSLDPRPGHYGVSAIVGGIELTPLEVAGVYTTLARGGTPVAVGLGHLTEACNTPGAAGCSAEHAPAAGRPVMGSGAAWLVERALRARDRPDVARIGREPPPIAWKTGTSFGHRDAWAAGWNRRYTGVVWLGNLDRAPSAALVGAGAAAPILFDLFAVVDPDADPMPDDPSSRVFADGRRPAPELGLVEVCAMSGYVPGPACTERRAELAVMHAVPSDPCPFHVAFEVDVASGLQVAPGCRTGPSETRAGVVWPAEVRRWLSDLWLAAPERPPLAPGCAPPSSPARARGRFG